MKALWCLCIAAIAISCVIAEGEDHRYKFEQEVPFYVNIIGPYANPSETYEYYTLPYCLPEGAEHRHLGLGEIISGNADVRINAQYDLRFKVDVDWRALCTMTLKPEDVQEFERAILEDYYFQMTVDDLPVLGFVGSKGATQLRENADGEEVEVTPLYLFTHLGFIIKYNGDQIIAVEIVAQRTELVPNEVNTFEFSYSATWKEIDFPFERRMELLSEGLQAKDTEIHWLSIMNSAVLAILLSAFLAVIVMRILNADYARYSKLADPEADEADIEGETGWKVLHADVFRTPPFSAALASAIGNGVQVLIIVTGTLFLGVTGVIYPYSRGTQYTAAVALYAITCVVNGYVSASTYKKLGGERWVWNIMLTAMLLAGPAFGVWAVLNSVAWAYMSTQALPATTVIQLMLIWLFVGFPLNVIGGIAGRNLTAPLEAPCRTVVRPRDIPAVIWYRSPALQIILAGVLPFSAIYIELDYIFNAVWGHQTYTLYGMLLLAFFILLVVTGCISVALTYFQLSAEDHRWWWRAFFSGGSTAWYIFAYAAFFFLYRSDMNGFMQVCYFFGYAALMSLVFFLLLGTIGFLFSFIFVLRIYRVIKSD